MLIPSGNYLATLQNQVVSHNIWQNMPEGGAFMGLVVFSELTFPLVCLWIQWEINQEASPYQHPRTVRNRLSKLSCLWVFCVVPNYHTAHIRYHRVYNLWAMWQRGPVNLWRLQCCGTLGDADSKEKVGLNVYSLAQNDSLISDPQMWGRYNVTPWPLLPLCLP